MDILARLAAAAVIPVVVIDDAKDAVPAAKALLAGGVDVMEITFRTAAAADAIKAVAEHCPDMLVGAGTVITLDQCRKAAECGARFIVAPGFDEEVVRWCVENHIAVTPGCVTPSEIMAAMKLGLKVVKFFPAGVYGGLSAMKALSGPFGGIKFIPTGGVNGQNIGEFIAAPFIHAKGDITAAITRFTDAGGGVVFVSSELTEMIENCDRILLIKYNRIVGMKGEHLVDYPVDEALEMTKSLDPVLIDVCNTISI